jgi:hypothetical protein
LHRDEILRTLREQKPTLRNRYGVRSLALLGSVARGEATAASDVDLLVDFSSPPGLSGYMSLKFYLEELLAHRVDLVMHNALKPQARALVAEEAVDVA